MLFALIVCHSLSAENESSAPATEDNVQQQEQNDTETQESEQQGDRPRVPASSHRRVAPQPSLAVYNFGAPKSPSGIYEGYVSLYSDHKARSVGDIVTIIIAESSKASKSASTKTSKKSGASSSLSDLFGVTGLPLNMGTDAQSDYTGAGSTTRSGSMEAKISATVKEVLPNGDLLLEGTREIVVNDDVQTITISGVIRPQAINSDNSVLSTYIANARITYVGKGPTAQRPGIITRILQTPFHWIASIFGRIF